MKAILLIAMCLITNVHTIGIKTTRVQWTKKSQFSRATIRDSTNVEMAKRLAKQKSKSARFCFVAGMEIYNIMEFLTPIPCMCRVFNGIPVHGIPLGTLMQCHVCTNIFNDNCRLYRVINQIKRTLFMSL